MSYNVNYRTSVNLTMTTPLPVIPTTDFPVQIDRERLQAAMANSRAPSTRRCYASQWNLWSAWARERGLEEMASPPAAVANFLVDRADAGASIATVRLARAALSAIHRDAGRQYTHTVNEAALREDPGGPSPIAPAPPARTSTAALEEGFRQGVAQAMSDGILTRQEEERLRTFRSEPSRIPQWYNFTAPLWYVLPPPLTIKRQAR